MILVPTKTQKEICDYVAKLVAEQNCVGSWGTEEPNLETSVVTCQATHFLSSFRGKVVSDALERAVEWLTRPAVASSEYTYWRYIPLHEANASQEDLELAIAHLQDKVQLGIKHHENSPLQEYYVLCRLKHGSLDSLATKIVNESIHDLANPPSDWSPEKVALKLVTGVLANSDGIENVAPTAIDRLLSCSTHKNDSRYWHSLVATAYIQMNLLQLRYRFDGTSVLGRKIASVITETTRYLVTQWDKKNFISEPLAGGVFDKTHYNQIVVARALVEVLDIHQPRWREPFLSQQLQETTAILGHEQTTVAVACSTDKHTLPNSAWSNGSFYMVVIIILSILFTVIGYFTNFFFASGAMFIAIIGLAAIGALQLKNDDRLKEKSFLKLMSQVLASPVEFFKRNNLKK